MRTRCEVWEDVFSVHPHLVAFAEGLLVQKVEEKIWEKMLREGWNLKCRNTLLDILTRKK
jgi:hypothetical protein